MIGEERLASLLCARMSHDLAGPIGAVSAGAELLADPAAGVDREAVELIGENARALTERLRFYRLAFGVDGGGEADIAGVKKLAENFARTPSTNVPFTLEWAVNSLADKLAERLLLNLLLLAAGTLTRGGKIRLSGEGFNLKAEASGPGLRLADEIADALHLSLSFEGLSPKTVLPCLVGLLAKRINHRAHATANADNVHFEIKTCLD
jgi:histidine phosphotransferase ChpT